MRTRTCVHIWKHALTCRLRVSALHEGTSVCVRVLVHMGIHLCVCVFVYMGTHSECVMCVFLIPMCAYVYGEMRV